MLSPINTMFGIQFKRDDLYRRENGVNGSKLRACEYLIDRAIRDGAKSVVSGAACISPQHAIVSTICRERGLPYVSIIGGVDAEKAVKNHKSVAIAHANGASFISRPVGFNPALQRAAKQHSEETGSYVLRYGIAIEDDASVADIKGFHSKVAEQCANVDVDELILPFGSGNTGVGVLYGLALKSKRPKTVHLMEIGPSRRAWADDRLEALGIKRGLAGLPYEVRMTTLHNTWAKYMDRMPYKLGTIKFHPTYEGKIIKYLETHKPAVWKKRDGSVGFWVVGGEL